MSFRWHVLAFVGTSVGRVNIEFKKKLKKTIPVARDMMSQAPTPPSPLLLLGCVGFHGLFVGLHWPMLAVVGFCGLSFGSSRVW